MREYKYTDDRYNEEMLDRVFLYGMTGLKKRLKKAENAIGFIAACTFAIITALLVTSDFGSTAAGVVLSVLIGGAVGGGIACLAIPLRKREPKPVVVKRRLCSAEKKGRRVEKEGSAA